MSLENTLAKKILLAHERDQTRIVRDTDSYEPFYGDADYRWVRRAARLRGRCFQVAMMQLDEANRRRSYETTISTTKLREIDINRYAEGRALESLEEAGLIRVQDRTGDWISAQLIGAVCYDRVDSCTNAQKVSSR